MLIFIAMFLAIGLNPAVVRLTRWGVPRVLAVAAVGLGAMLLLCGGLLALIPPLVTQTGALVENLPSYIDNLRNQDQLNKLNEDYKLLDQLKAVATAGNVTKALGGVWGGAQVVFSALFNILTVVVLTLYFMAAFDRLKEGGYKLVPASRRHRGQPARRRDPDQGRRLPRRRAGDRGHRGHVVVRVPADPRIKYSYALAVLVAITDLIPQIGATLGAIVVEHRRLRHPHPGRHRLRHLLRHLPAGRELPDLPDGDAPGGEGQRPGRDPVGAARRGAHGRRRRADRDPGRRRDPADRPRGRPSPPGRPLAPGSGPS